LVSRAVPSNAIGFFILKIMAQDKKGFILYADQKELFEQLPDSKAGELIKHIFKYVNDENPISDDLIINLAFTPIKQQLKRDLLKFEEAKKQRSEAGKRSAALRKEQRTSTNPTSVESRSTKSTVTVNDKVKVNVKDTVKEEEDNRHRQILELAIDYKKNERVINAVLKNGQQLAFSKEDLITKLDDFILHLESTGETIKTKKDFNTHFLNWLRVKKKKGSEKSTKPTAAEKVFGEYYEEANTIAKQLNNLTLQKNEQENKRIGG